MFYKDPYAMGGKDGRREKGMRESCSANSCERQWGPDSMMAMRPQGTPRGLFPSLLFYIKTS
jgi:hypothetical protein